MSEYAILGHALGGAIGTALGGILGLWIAYTIHEWIEERRHRKILAEMEQRWERQRMLFKK